MLDFDSVNSIKALTSIDRSRFNTLGVFGGSPPDPLTVEEINVVRAMPVKDKQIEQQNESNMIADHAENFLYDQLDDDAFYDPDINFEEEEKKIRNFVSFYNDIYSPQKWA